MSDKKEKDLSEETRVLEVRRTIRAVKEETNSEKLVFNLVGGEWKFHTAGAYDLDIPTLKEAVVQLEELAKSNPGEVYGNV